MRFTFNHEAQVKGCYLRVLEPSTQPEVPPPHAESIHVFRSCCDSALNFFRGSLIGFKDKNSVVFEWKLSTRGIPLRGIGMELALDEVRPASLGNFAGSVRVVGIEYVHVIRPG
jgi:hypothetical protein